MCLNIFKISAQVLFSVEWKKSKKFRNWVFQIYCGKLMVTKIIGLVLKWTGGLMNLVQNKYLRICNQNILFVFLEESASALPWSFLFIPWKISLRKLFCPFISVPMTQN
jgi:hypothetical protein